MNTTQKLIRNKIGLINLAEELGNISKACSVMGFSRQTFYRYQELIEEGGVDNLIESCDLVRNRLSGCGRSVCKLLILFTD